MRALPTAHIRHFLFLSLLVLAASCGEDAPIPDTQADPTTTTQEEAADPADETDPTDTATGDAADPADE